MAQLEPEDFYDVTRPRALAVAPDGDRVAIVADQFDPEAEERHSSLFVVPADGSKEPHRLTRVSDARQPKWSPDGTQLAFIAAREQDVERAVGRDETSDDSSDDDEDEATGSETDDTPDPQVWLFDLARGGDAIQVTDRAEGVNEFDWGPNGERLVIAARDPTDDEQADLEQRREGGPIETERLQHKADGTGWLDTVTTYLFVVDVESGDTERLDDAYGQGAREATVGLQPAWGPSDRIAFASNRTDRPDDSGVMDLYTIAPDGTGLRKLTDSISRTYAYRWGPDGEELVYADSDPNNWYKPTNVRVVTVEDEDPTHRTITADLDRTVSLYGTPTWLADDQVLIPIGDEGLTRLVTASIDETSPSRTFPAQTRDRSLLNVAADGDTVAVVLSDPADGPEVFTIDVSELDAEDPASLTQVTAFNESLLAEFNPSCRRVTYDTEDGAEVEAIVHLPPGFDPETDVPRPVIASIHGGPMSYDAPDFRFLQAYWVSQGYVVYRPNYRGSTSYGRAFAEELMGTRGDLETLDVVGGLDTLADRGWVDPDQSLVTGFSYGGITTANVITRRDDFAAAAAEHGIYDFQSTFGTDDNHLWHEWEFGLPWENPDTYTQISSITDVDNVETPVLLTAGENDWRCPPTQAEQFYVRVRKRGIPAKLVIYQDEHHNVGAPDRAIHRIETLTEWFREHALNDE